LAVIWSKTEAGRAEVQARALVKERLQRNLLLLIDGVKTEEMLLANVAGLKPDDFKFLESLNLITPTASSSGSRSSSSSSASSDRGGAATQPMSLPPSLDERSTWTTAASPPPSRSSSRPSSACAASR
jgi:hypothetical protein